MDLLLRGSKHSGAALLHKNTCRYNDQWQTPYYKKKIFEEQTSKADMQLFWSNLSVNKKNPLWFIDVEIAHNTQGLCVKWGLRNKPCNILEKKLKFFGIE